MKIGYYNDRGQMWRNVRGSGMVSKATFDAIGRVASMQIILPGTASDNVFNFGYNPASQMINRTTSNDLYANTAHYDVDRNYQVNGLNQYTQAGPAAFQYDDNGNLTNDGSVTFTYDVENRLVAASGARTAELIYDPLGRLWEINSGTNASKQRLLYDGDALVAEYDYLGNITQRYMHDNGADQPLVWYEGSAVGASNRRHLFTNWQGSITAVTDSAGTALAVNAYDAYGIPNDTNIGRFSYTGQIWIPELGLYHYKARAYSPTLGRFMQTDPIGYEDQYNLYAYVGNDPVNLVDPTGEQIQKRDDDKKVIFVYPRRTHDHVERNHSAASARGNVNGSKSKYNNDMTKDQANALAGRTIQGAENQGNVREESGNRTVYENEETGWFSSLGTRGEDSNRVVTIPLTKMSDPRMISDATKELMKPEMLAAIGIAEVTYGDGVSVDDVLEKVEVQVIVTQYPIP